MIKSGINQNRTEIRISTGKGFCGNHPIPGAKVQISLKSFLYSEEFLYFCDMELSITSEFILAIAILLSMVLEIIQKCKD